MISRQTTCSVPAWRVGSRGTKMTMQGRNSILSFFCSKWNQESKERSTRCSSWLIFPPLKQWISYGYDVIARDFYSVVPSKTILYKGLSRHEKHMSEKLLSKYKQRCSITATLFGEAETSSKVKSRESSFGIATGYGTGQPGFDSRSGQKIFFYSTASRPTLGPCQHSIQRETEGCFPEIKRPGREADHSPPLFHTSSYSGT
jgi:hypothetical protein